MSQTDYDKPTARRLGTVLKIAKFLSDGDTAAQIGEKSFLSKRTIEGYIRCGLKYYKAKSSVHLIAILMRNGSIK